MRTRILFVVGVGMLLMSIVFSPGVVASQEKSSKTKQKSGQVSEIKSSPTGAQAKAGGVTYTNGQVCSVYTGGFRDTFTVPDGFSITGCEQLKGQLGAVYYQLGCASPTGIAFSPQGATTWGCGWH
jgi:hypothetical protein